METVTPTASTGLGARLRARALGCPTLAWEAAARLAEGACRDHQWSRGFKYQSPSCSTSYLPGGHGSSHYKLEAFSPFSLHQSYVVSREITLTYPQALPPPKPSPLTVTVGPPKKGSSLPFHLEPPLLPGCTPLFSTLGPQFRGGLWSRPQNTGGGGGESNTAFIIILPLFFRTNTILYS